MAKSQPLLEETPKGWPAHMPNSLGELALTLRRQSLELLGLNLNSGLKTWKPFQGCLVGP